MTWFKRDPKMAEYDAYSYGLECCLQSGRLTAEQAGELLEKKREELWGKAAA